MGYQVVWRRQFSMVQGPNLCCGLHVYMNLSHIPRIENFPMTLHEFLLCYCWVPALVNAFFPDTVNDVFPSLVNVFPESCRWCFPRVFSMSSQVIVIVSCHWCLEDDLYQMPFACWKTLQTRSGWRTTKAITGSLSKEMERLSLEPDLDYPNRDQWCSLLHSWTPNATPSR